MSQNEPAVLELGDEVLKLVAQELVKAVPESTGIDWSLKESVRAGLRAKVRRLLTRYDYPPGQGGARHPADPRTSRATGERGGVTGPTSVDWGTVPAWGAVLGAVIAGVAVFVQRHNSRVLGRIERTVALHRDITTGEVGAARDRFTELMWREGSNIKAGRCYQPRFAELLKPEFTDGPAPVNHRKLADYPKDLTTVGASPSRDLYKVLWCFERIHALIHSKQLDQDLAVKLLGRHTVWWNSLCAEISDDDTMHRGALEQAARWMILKDPGLKDTARHDFGNGDLAS